MESLVIKGSKRTPEIVLDKVQEKFLISGRSLPENTASYYAPVLDWFNQYLNEPNPKTILTFELNYFNSSSSKVFLEMIFKMQEILNKGLDAKINWCYTQDDIDDILEAGQIFESLTRIPFIYTVCD